MQDPLGLPGLGTGVFLPRVDTAVGMAPRECDTGDFNGDGKVDIVVANSGSNNLQILLNTSK